MLPRLRQILQLLVDCHRGHGTAQTKEKFRKKAFGTESISTLFSSQLKKQYSLRPLQRGVSLQYAVNAILHIRPCHPHAINPASVRLCRLLGIACFDCGT